MVEFGVERIGEEKEKQHLQRLEDRVNRAKEFGDKLIIEEAEQAYDYFKREYEL